MADHRFADSTMRVLAAAPILVGALLAATELNRYPLDRTDLLGVPLHALGLALALGSLLPFVLGRLVTELHVNERKVTRHRSFLGLRLFETSRVVDALRGYRSRRVVTHGVRGRGTRVGWVVDLVLPSSQFFGSLLPSRTVSLGPGDAQRLVTQMGLRPV